MKKFNEQFRDFNKLDLFEFSGAENLPSGSYPIIFEINNKQFFASLVVSGCDDNPEKFKITFIIGNDSVWSGVSTGLSGLLARLLTEEIITFLTGDQFTANYANLDDIKAFLSDLDINLE